MKLVPIEKRTGLTREEFIENYLKPSRPVVFTDLAKDWPAVQKWTFEWLRENHGNLDVPLVDNHIHDADKYFQIAKTMKKKARPICVFFFSTFLRKSLSWQTISVSRRSWMAF
jgi:hypothetical protein